MVNTSLFRTLCNLLRQAILGRLGAVKYAAKLGVCAMILVLAGAQPLACMLPGGATAEEQAACCREMGPDCNSGDMPSSHSCCQTTSAPDRVALAKASFKLAVTLL